MSMPYTFVVVHIVGYSFNAANCSIVVCPGSKVTRIRNIQVMPDEPIYIHEHDLQAINKPVEEVCDNMFILHKNDMFRCMASTSSGFGVVIHLSQQYYRKLRISTVIDPEMLLWEEERYCIFRWDMLQREMISWLAAVKVDRDTYFELNLTSRKTIHLVMEFIFDPRCLASLQDCEIPPICSKQVKGCFITSIPAFDYMKKQQFVAPILMNYSNRLIFRRIMTKNN